MPVFDFSNSKTEKKDPECTYTTFQSNEKVPSPEKPILIIDNKSCQWKHHSCGVFTNPIKKTSFEFDEEDGTVSADIPIQTRNLLLNSKNRTVFSRQIFSKLMHVL